MKAKPLSERLCDALVFGVAAWTLCCNVVVLAGGGLHAVMRLAGLVLVLFLVWKRWSRTRSAADDSPADRTRRETGPPIESSAAAVPRLPWRIAAWSLAFVLGAAAVAGASTLLLWWLAVIGLGALTAHDLRSSLHLEHSADQKGAALLASVALVLALTPLFAHRTSVDDGYYLNVVVHAVDDPSAPLLTYDTLHGIPDLPIMYAVYKTHSFEVLGAAVSALTGLSATQACHWVLPSFFGFFLALAWAILAKRLAPRNWVWVWLATLAVLLFARQGNQDPAAFSILRFHQGKSVFISVLFPLLLLYGMEFSARPSRAAWLRLAAAQIASIGMTSTALWAAPLAAALGLAAGANLSLASLRRVLVGLGASSYVVGLGAYLASQMFEADAAALVDSDGVRLVRVSAAPITASDELVRSGFQVVYGSGRFALFALFAMVPSWAASPSSALRRALVVPTLAVLLLLANPFFALDVAERITGGSTYWRVFWLMPIPLAIGVLSSLPARRFSGWLGSALALLAVFLFLAVIPDRFNFRGVRWEPFGLKVPRPKVYDAALYVRDNSPEGSWVLAPGGIAPWIVSLHDHPYPLSSRPNWMNAQAARIGHEEADRRRLLLRYVTGYVEPEGPAALIEAVDDYPLTSVTLLRGTPSTKSARDILRMKGYERTFSNEEYETWIRP